MSSSSPQSKRDECRERVHFSANAGYPAGKVNQEVADALEAGELIEVDGGYVVSDSDCLILGSCLTPLTKKSNSSFTTLTFSQRFDCLPLKPGKCFCGVIVAVYLIHPSVARLACLFDNPVLK